VGRAVTIRIDVLDGAQPLPVPTRGQDGERSCGATWCVAEGGGRGRGRPRISVCGLGPVWLRRASVARLLLVGLSGGQLVGVLRYPGIITLTKSCYTNFSKELILFNILLKCHYSSI
jgi:hypothetical protein